MMILSGATLEEFKQEALKKWVKVGRKIKVHKKKAVITEVSKYLFTCDYGTYKESFSFVDAMLDKRIQVEV